MRKGLAPYLCRLPGLNPAGDGVNPPEMHAIETIAGFTPL